MEIELNEDIKYLKGVGPKMAEKLHRLGIETVSNLIFHWPRRYEDYTQVTKIRDLRIFNDQFSISNQYSKSNFQTIRAKVIGVTNKLTSRRRMKVTEAVVADETGTIKLIWFNQPFLKEYLRPGSEWYFHGKISSDPFRDGLVMESSRRQREAAIVPVYPETRGINSNYINKLISGLRVQILKSKDFLPAEIIDKYGLVTLNEAIDNLHFPKSLDHLGKARKRIAFDELFLISLRAKIGRQEIEKASAPAININEKLIKEYVSSLPFSLTNDQRKAAWQIVKDLDQGTPMNRLLNGDVGSGKTVVAAIAAYAVIKSGYRVVLMAPTEVLASQHYQTFCGLFSNLDISVGLLTSSIKKLVVNPKSEILNPKQIQNMENSKFPNNPVKADIVIGTHALLQKSINLENVGLIIVDEQHRFGVRQRALLKDKTDNKIKPHFLSMTATPIPRTLHLSLFGDLDISIISEKPKNRKEIKTRFVEPENRSKAYEFIRNQIKNGRQAFVICPLIEDVDDSSLMSSSDLIRGSSNNNSRFQIKSGMTTQGELFDQDRKSVMKEYEKLRKEVFPEYKVAMLHGKMKPKEKDEILGQFAAGKSDVLVSTSVIEVGINVPNATVMMIEDAERFGLAQIHQFRGRVGRAEHQSFCFLFSNTKNPKAFQRLKSLEAVSDGFRLAEIDLENRGPGEIFGILQSGQLELKMASFSDRILIEEAAEAADEILKLSRDLSKFPQLAKKLAEFEMNKHME